MADTLKVYKGADVVGTAERGEDGKAKVTIDSLDANTDYVTGTYQVSFSNENGESEKVDVPSFKTKPIAVTGVTIAPKTASVDVDATTKLNSTVAPSTATNKSVSYKSSDDAIATVSSNGTVTGVAEGETTITVTTQDGNKTDTATVTVNAAVINVTGVAIEPETATLEIGETQQLTPTVAPANASDKTVTYASNAQGIASVDDNGLITGKTEGTTQIVVTTKDGNRSATCDVTVNSPEPEPEPEPEVPEEPEE